MADKQQTSRLFTGIPCKRAARVDLGLAVLFISVGMGVGHWRMEAWNVSEIDTKPMPVAK